MRIDLTLREDGGRELDVAVVARAGTTYGAVADALGHLLGSRPEWVANRRLAEHLVLGMPPLTSGAVLATSRDATSVPATGRRVVVLGGPDAGREVPLSSRPVVIGRGRECDLVLTDPQVSRRHAAVRLSGGRPRVRDLGSTNGTWLGDERLPAQEERALCDGDAVRIGHSVVAVRDGAEPRVATRPAGDGTVLVSRAGQVVAVAEHDVVPVPTPPGARHRQRLQLAAAVLPAIAGAVLAWATRSWLFLAFAALGPVTLTATALGDRLHGRRSDRRGQRDYRAALAAVERVISARVRAEAVDRRRSDPDPAAVARIAGGPTARLWHRARGDDALLRVRVGLGPAPSRVQLDRDGTAQPAAQLDLVPVTVDLARGALGIVAPHAAAAGITRAALLHLCTLVSPADLHLVVLAADPSLWHWTRWLPHLRAAARLGSGDAERLLGGMTRTVRQRLEAGSHERWTGPRLLLLVDPAGSGVPAGVAEAVGDGRPVGVAAVCLAARRSELPLPCGQVVEATGDAGTTVRITTPDGSVVAAADRVDARRAELVARALARLRDAHAGGDAQLPDHCRFTDLLDAVSAGSLEPNAIRERWQESRPSLSTPVGAGAGTAVTIDLSRDGPHLLVAGTTGSGKSELLQTLVAGLALLHPPTDVTFLLVDYKGGAAFAGCAELPHTVGMVTDLDARLSGRVLTSLDSEVRRRERLLAAAGVRDLDSLRATGEAPARLVIVVDEFATLVDDLPDVVTGLVSIAQRGRSLGLHLVLATQRPAGVVSPEIRANVALRVCLRVLDPAESCDVLDSSVAAAIGPHTPGRGYLRAGSTPIAVQCARVTLPRARTPHHTVVRPLEPWRRLPGDPGGNSDSDRDEAPGSDLDAIVDAARAAASHLPPPPRPWLPPLPSTLTGDELCTPRPTLVPYGLLDLPADQRRDMLALDLDAGGVVLVVGRARSGRTSTLTALARSAALRLSPEQVHLHAIDAAGAGLESLRSLPHTGTVASARDGFDLTARLVERLGAEVEARRDAHGGGDARPALLLLVDGWEAFAAGSDDHDGGRTAQRLLDLLAGAAAAQVSVAVAGGRSALAPRLATHAATRLVLALNDAADHLSAGLDARALPPALPGRGRRAPDGAEFQIAAFGAAADPVGDSSPRDPSTLRLRTLPRRVQLASLPRRAGCWTLGVGGDTASAVLLDPTQGSRRLLIAGPQRAGRSALLVSLLHQAAPASSVVVAAPPGSPLVAAALRHGCTVLDADRPDLAVLAVEARAAGHDAAGHGAAGHGAAGHGGARHGVVLVDDVDALIDTPLDDALTRLVRSRHPRRPVVVAAARSDALATTFRGLAADLRRSRCGVLLQPGAADGDLFGITLPRSRAAAPAGRGVLVADPAWQTGDPMPPIQPIQLALSPCGDTCDP